MLVLVLGPSYPAKVAKATCANTQQCCNKIPTTRANRAIIISYCTTKLRWPISRKSVRAGATKAPKHRVATVFCCKSSWKLLWRVCFFCICPQLPPRKQFRMGGAGRWLCAKSDQTTPWFLAETSQTPIYCQFWAIVLLQLFRLGRPRLRGKYQTKTPKK